METNPAPESKLTPTLLAKAGIRTTQFWLIVGVLLLVAAMVFSGKLDAGWFVIAAPIVSVIYSATRTDLYRDLATHPNDALDQILATLLDGTSLDGSELCAIVKALREHAPIPLPAILSALPPHAPGQEAQGEPSKPKTEDVDQASSAAPPGTGSGIGPRPVALLALFCGLSFLFAGCAARTTFWDRTSGKKIAEFQGDMTKTDYSDGVTKWGADAVNHSQPTLAMGHAVKQIVKAGTNGAAGVVLAVETGGASTGVQAGLQKLAAPAAVISSNATGNAPPLSTPTPVKTH